MSDRYAAYRAAPPSPPPITLAQHDAILGELARLNWTAEQKAAYLSHRWGYTHAIQLDTIQARAFLDYLRGLQP